ncbi:MAG: DNA-binding response regulator [Cytophagia bacterium]|nr:DNA-binding response regulator [Cytophagia bacterium]
MKIVIVEDEPLVAKDLERLIREALPTVEIEAVLGSVTTAKQWFAKNTMPDLIFSDIRLSDGVSFEIYEALAIACPIIFTTAYDEYALRAFKINSIDYLLKPIDAKELASALNKYRAVKDSQVLHEQLQTLLVRWQDVATKRYKERFLALQRNALVPINENEIAHFHKNEIIHLHTINGEKFISEHQTLDEIEQLINPKVFFRVNRQYLVHIQAVGRVKTTHKGLTVELKGTPSTEIDISREKATAFKEWLA